MSPGQQLISVLIDTIGFFIEAIIASIFAAVVEPLLQAIFAGLGGGA